MRLINVHTLEIQSFSGTNIPQYAILSHTWGTKEATFQKWTNKWSRLTHKHTSGYHKVLATCKQARHDGLKYAWVDTGCIDKSSSAELSEAINSMYTWYKKATICYVYLSDLAASDTFDSLREGRWFTRGWTLQELIAPDNVQLYTKD